MVTVLWKDPLTSRWEEFKTIALPTGVTKKVLSTRTIGHLPEVITTSAHSQTGQAMPCAILIVQSTNESTRGESTTQIDVIVVTIDVAIVLEVMPTSEAAAILAGIGETTGAVTGAMTGAMTGVMTGAISSGMADLVI